MSEARLAYFQQSCGPAQLIQKISTQNYQLPAALREPNFHKDGFPRRSPSETKRDDGPQGIEGHTLEETENAPGSPEFLQEAPTERKTEEDIVPGVTCVYCNKVFPSPNALEAHQRAMHKGKKVYECPVCDKQFIHRSSRTIHMRIHTGQRPYECQICKKRFRVTSHLRDHIRTHTGERPFKCSVCGRGFKQSSDMKKHRKTHNKALAIDKRMNKAEHHPEQRSTETSYTVVRSEDTTIKSDDLSPNDLTSPNERANLKLVIKVERKTKETSVVSPLSNDSGVKVDYSSSPDNVLKENTFRHQETPQRVFSPTGIVASSKRSGDVNFVMEPRGVKRVYTGWDMPVVKHSTSGDSVDTSGSYGNTRDNSVPNEQPLPTPDNPVYPRYESPNLNNDEEVSPEYFPRISLQRRQAMEFRPHDVTRNNDFRSDDVTKEDNIAKSEGVVRRCDLVNGDVMRNSDVIRNNIVISNGVPRNGEIKNDDVMRYNSDVTTTRNDVTVFNFNDSNYTSLNEFHNGGLVSSPTLRISPGQAHKVVNTQGSTAHDNVSNGVSPLEIQTAAFLDNLDVENDDCEGEVTKQEVQRLPAVVNGAEHGEIHPVEKQAKQDANTNMHCAICTEAFDSAESLSAHNCLAERNCQTKTLSFKCHTCAKVFARQTLLRQHVVLHQGTKRFKFKCNYCGRAFRHRSHLRDHERIHTGERPFQCTFCPKAFKQSSDLRKHENLHTGATRYRCEKCAVDFKRCDALKKHAMMHREGEVTLMKCDKCHSLFATADGHLSHTCQNKNYLRCQLCVRRFSTAAGLRQHCLIDHGSRPSSDAIKCEFCNIELPSLSDLERHLESHQLMKTHKCSTCEQQFSLICQLEKHMKIHSNKNTESAATTNDENPPQAIKIEKLDRNEVTDTGYQNATFQSELDTTGDHITPSEIPTSQLPGPGHKPHHTYDFIPSSYQSLVPSTPYGYPQRIPALKPVQPDTCSTPRVIKPHENATPRRKVSEGNRYHDEPVRKPAESSRYEDEETPSESIRYEEDRGVQMSEESYWPRNATEREHQRNGAEQYGHTIGYQFRAKRKYTCLTCTHAYYSETGLLEHVCDIKSETFYECTVCEEEFVYYEELMEHMKRHWRTLVYLKCSLCGERFRNEDRLKEHNLIHIRATTPQKTEYDNNPISPSADTRVDRGQFGKTGTIPAVTSYGATVITSVSGAKKEGAFSRPASPTQGSQREYGGQEYMKTTVMQTTAGNLERSFSSVQSVADEATRMPYVPYFGPWKSASRAYVNVFGQNPAIVVSPSMYERRTRC